MIGIMREEAKLWWKHALKNIEVALRLLDEDFYSFAAFHAHQAAESALKALIIENLRELPPKVHSLIELANALKEESLDISPIEDDIKDLNPHYTISRYPDAANGVPSEVYSRRMAEGCVKMAERILEWVISKMRT